MVTRYSLALLTALLVLVAASKRASAFSYQEHYDVCYAAYLAACQELEQDLNTQDVSTKRRFMQVCGTSKTVRSMASRFGEACAVAGDSVPSPQEMLSESAYVNSRWKKLVLASGNAEHFHPTTVYRFNDFYADAIKGAVTASSSIEQEGKVFQRAFYDMAFAAHHLADAHAAGHMGFHRANSGATVSGVIHNRFNKKGRWVRDLSGNVWRTYGDKYICNGSQSKAKQPDYPEAILTVEKLRCADEEPEGDPPPVFRIVSHNVYIVVKVVLQAFVTGTVSEYAQAPDTLLPHDIWRDGKWFSSINYSPARIRQQIDFLARGVGSKDFSTNIAYTWTPLYLFRPRMSVGLGFDGSGVDHVEGAFGVVFTPDIPFNIFTPEIVAEGRYIYPVGDDDNPTVWIPSLGGRMMIESYYFNLTVEVGAQMRIQNTLSPSQYDIGPYVTLGFGKVLETWGARPVLIRPVDHFLESR